MAMNETDARELRELGLRAVEQLSDLLNLAKERCSEEEYESIRRGVGLSIGRIQLEVLDVVGENYPQIEDRF